MKKMKLVTITLLIVSITLIAFAGVYIQTQNRMENKVKDYSYAMDLKGVRSIRLGVNAGNQTVIKDAEGKEVTDTQNLTEEQIAENGYVKEEFPYNTEEVKTLDNYKKAKEIIEKRLEGLAVDNYIIKLNEETGEILIEVAENTRTNSIVSNLNMKGNFKISDSETKEVLMDNHHIKSANVTYANTNATSTTQGGTTVYLNINFTEEGTQKIKEISEQYVATAASTDQTSTEETKTDEKKVTLTVDNAEIISTAFDAPVTDGKLSLSIGTGITNNSTFQTYVEQAANLATVLNNGELPVTFQITENEYIVSDITNREITFMQYVLLGIMIIGFIVLIYRYKMLGLLSSIAFIGFVSLFTLIIRYANVLVSLEGIAAMILVLALNYIFVNKVLAKLKAEAKDINKVDIQNATNETYKEFFIKIIPVLITVITFCFMRWVPVSSFGMVMFWGIALIALYHIVITNNLLKISVKK